MHLFYHISRWFSTNFAHFRHISQFAILFISYKTQNKTVEIVKKIWYNILKYGGVAQLGERLNGIQEVIGSIPTVSTNKKPDLSNRQIRLFE